MLHNEAIFYGIWSEELTVQNGLYEEMHKIPCCENRGRA